MVEYYPPEVRVVGAATGYKHMKILIPVLFVVMGGVFLLVSTALYPEITRLLLNLEQGAGAPAWWNLAAVLKIVRVIFFIVGFFLAVFGVALFFNKTLFGLNG